MKNKLPENNSTRLASLDILRGFDLFLLVFFQPVFAALVRQMNLPFLNGILYQFDHEVWEGFRFWDLVHRYYRKLLACISQDFKAGYPVVYFRDDCTGQFVGA